MSYLKIAKHYSECFKKHGNTPKGLDWDNQDNMNKRYRVMENLFFMKRDEYPTILDFGCGTGGFYEYLQNNYRKDIEYSGIDINLQSLSIAEKKYSQLKFWCLDILNERRGEYYKNEIPNFDYIICNGIFTVKHTLSQEEMTNFMCSTLEKLWTKTNKGIAFNCMSKVLDYERDDLFHVSFDQLSQWIYDNMSSKFTIRQDYSLREFTMYVYK